MRKLLFVISLLLVLVATVTGCGGAHRYDSRLTAADSRMMPNPDSALATVEAICPDSLPDEGDRAYRDLLLTQARYRCYVTATSDSDINRALNYYRAHSGEREKLTRAYIYKGAVMDELGHPDSAMLYYKHAEATAAPDDYFNLGYAKMRIGSLYRDYYAFDGRHIQYYKEAIENIAKTENTDYLLICMNNLANAYRESRPQLAEEMLKKLISLSFLLNDTNKIIENSHSLALLYYANKQYDKAYKQAHTIIELNQEDLDIETRTTIANVYAKVGKTDSARLLLNNNPLDLVKESDYEKMYVFESLGVIALALKDTATYMRLTAESEKIANSLTANESRLIIFNTEQQFENDAKNNFISRHKISLRTIMAIAIAAIISVLSLIIIHYKRKHRYDKLISDIINEYENNEVNFSALQQRIDKLHITEQQQKDFINSHISIIREITEACYHEPRNKLAKELNKIIKYQNENKDVWVKVYDYIDLEFNNIMTETRQNFINLNERDYLLIALTCLDFSCAQIAIITGYANATSISGNRQRLAKKMGLTCSLGNYIEHYKG